MTLSTAINGGGGGSVNDLSASVPNGTTGALYTLYTSVLSGTVTWTKVSGNANLTVSGGAIVAAAGLSAGASQSIVVRGVSGNDAVEFQVTLTGAITVPAAPSINLTPGNGQISIAWTDGSNGGASITSHKLYRGTSSGSETLIGSIATGSPYVDTGLTNGTTYYYKLSAVNSVGESALSSEQSGTPSAAPTAYAHVFSANGQPDVWFDASDAATITSSGGLVDSIANKGTLGGSASSTTTNRPGTGVTTINGLNALDFSGSNHLDMSSELLSFPAQGYSLLTVFRNDETNTTTVRFLHIGQVAGTIGFGTLYNQSNFANRISTYLAGTTTATQYNATSNQGLNMHGVRGQISDGVTAGNKVGHQFYNGFEANTTGTSRADITLSGWRIGGNPGSNSSRALGKFCEMIGWKKSISLDDYQIIEGYLAAKWGVTLGLFAGAAHPWNGRDPRSTAYVRNFWCIGDSFTGESFLTTKWVDQLASVSGRQTRNAGIGGTDSNNILSRFLADDRYWDRITKGQMGRNDPGNSISTATTEANIAAFMADTRSAYKTIWPIFKNDDEWSGGSAAAAGATIDSINAWISSNYASKFVDEQAMLVALGAPGQAYQDNTNYPRGLVPGGLRYDNLHINNTSSPIVAANEWADAQARGW